MENEIKVNEYVRDNKGLIFYIIGVDYDDYITDIIYNPEIHKGYKGRYDFGVKDYLLYFTKEQISKLKHSPNLKDLIEIGDLVKIEDNDRTEHWFEIYDNSAMYQYEILEIVTKEMIESISYKVKE